jgi:hypothetical protein
MKTTGWHFSVHRANAWWVAHNASCATSSIAERFERSLDPGRLSRLPGAAPSSERASSTTRTLRRPLGLARSIPPERLIAVLDGEGTRVLAERAPAAVT